MTIADQADTISLGNDSSSPTKSSLARRILLRSVVVLIACTLAPTALLYVFQDMFVYETSSEVLSLQKYLPGGREISYRTSDGIELKAWFIAAKSPGPTCGAPPTAVLFHGQGGNRSWQYALANALSAHGVNAFIAEYRGFGNTEGSPSEDGLTIDARAAVDTAGAQPEVDPRRLVYVGYSLGTGVAVHAAVDKPPTALILLAPYTSLPDVAWTRMPGLPYKLLMHNRFDSLSRMAAIDAPITVVVGSADETVPNEQSRLIWNAVKNKGNYLVLDGVNHADVERRAGKLVIEPLASFITTHAGCR